MHPVRRRLSSPRSRIFLVGGVLGVLVALALGIADRPLVAALLVLGLGGVVAAFTPAWTRPRPFLLLAAAGALAFPVFVVLHNAFYALGEVTGDLPVVPAVAGALAAVTFLAAILLSPAVLLVGLVGALVTGLFRRPAPA